MADGKVTEFAKKVLPSKTLEAMKACNKALADVALLNGWRELDKQHEYMKFLVAPFEDNEGPCRADGAERLLEEYVWTMRTLITAQRDREEAMAERCREASMLKEQSA